MRRLITIDWNQKLGSFSVSPVALTFQRRRKSGALKVRAPERPETSNASEWPSSSLRVAMRSIEVAETPSLRSRSESASGRVQRDFGEARHQLHGTPTRPSRRAPG